MTEITLFKEKRGGSPPAWLSVDFKRLSSLPQIKATGSARGRHVESIFQLKDQDPSHFEQKRGDQLPGNRISRSECLLLICVFG